MQWPRPAGWNFSLHPWGAGPFAAVTPEVRVTRKLREDGTAGIAPNFFKLPPGWNVPCDCHRIINVLLLLLSRALPRLVPFAFVPSVGECLHGGTTGMRPLGSPHHTLTQTSETASRIQILCADLTLECWAYICSHILSTCAQRSQ